MTRGGRFPGARRNSYRCNGNLPGPVRSPSHRGRKPAGRTEPRSPSLARLALGLLVLVTPILPNCSLADSSSLLIKGGTLIDGTGHPPLPHAWILLEGDRIKAIGKPGSFPVPRGSNILQARGETILPGLIDAHVHLATSGAVSSAFPRPQSNAEEVFRRSLRSELLGGVTQVRDLHMPLEVGRRLAKQLQREPTLGARLIYAGPMLTAP